MKRFLKIVRKLLNNFEKEDDNVIENDHEMDGYPEDEVQYHFIQTDQAGIIRCKSSIASCNSDKEIRVYPFSSSLSK